MIFFKILTDNFKLKTMSCKRSFTTSTGTFTAYAEPVTKCEAERLCEQRGQILAPFTNEEDMRAAIDMFKGNNANYKNCDYTAIKTGMYHVGLNFKKRKDGSFVKSFSNGDRWSDEKHASLYEINPNKKLKCPEAFMMPVLAPYAGMEKFAIGDQSRLCSYQNNYNYMCLQPDGQSSSQPLVQDEVDSPVNKETPWFIVSCAAVFVAVFFACFAFVSYRKNKRSQEKLSELEGKMNANGIYFDEQV